jgi:3',5'-cyclic-AMP phosphodiesterase
MPQTLLQFIHISDTHIHYDPTYQSSYEYPSRKGAEALVEQLNTLPFTPDFVLHTGDVAYDPDPRAYEAVQEVLGKIRHPVIYLPGNHDDVLAMQQRLLGQAEVRKPLYDTFEINGVQIVCLDSNGPVEPPRGYLHEEQLAWLRDLCSANDPRPLIVAVHHNPLPTGIPWLDDYMSIVNGEELHEALLPARDRLRGVFHGHIHQNVDILRDGILYTSALSSWCQFHAWPGQVDTIPDAGAEPGFNVVTISHNQTFIRRCRFPIPR